MQLFKSLKVFVPLLVIGIVSLAATEAHASRARVLSLGSGDGGFVLGSTGNSGSFSIDDAYNMFYNPAFVNDYRDWATIEKSNFPGSTAQGGMVTSILFLNVGFYFNRVGPLADLGFSNSSLMRPIDLTLGMDLGFKWGVGFSVGNYSRNGSSNDFTMRAGVQIESLEPFLSYQINGSEPAGDHDSLLVGTRYRWGEWIPYLAYHLRERAGAGDHRMGLGIGRNTTFGEGGRLNYSLGWWRASGDNRWIVPIEVSAEADVLSWLTLRGGLAYRLIDLADGSSPSSDPASGRIGASFHIGSIDLDTVFGFAQFGNSGLESNASNSPDTYDSQHFGVDGGFFSAASLTVKW